MSKKAKMGRPPKGIIAPGSHISANIPVELANELRERSRDTGVAISFMVQKAIEAYLKASR